MKLKEQSNFTYY